jgi:hypothetical protein
MLFHQLTDTTFLREKHPDFKNFARKESLSSFDKEVTRLFIIPPDAQRSVGTLNRIDPKSRLIAVENVENRTQSFHVPPEVHVWMWVPTLRRMHRVSGLVDIPLGSAVQVVYGPSGEVRRIVFEPPYKTQGDQPVEPEYIKLPPAGTPQPTPAGAP